MNGYVSNYVCIVSSCLIVSVCELFLIEMKGFLIKLNQIIYFDIKRHQMSLMEEMMECFYLFICSAAFLSLRCSYEKYKIRLRRSQKIFFDLFCSN